MRKLLLAVGMVFALSGFAHGQQNYWQRRYEPLPLGMDSMNPYRPFLVPGYPNYGQLYQYRNWYAHPGLQSPTYDSYIRRQTMPNMISPRRPEQFFNPYRKW